MKLGIVLSGSNGGEGGENKSSKADSNVVVLKDNEMLGCVHIHRPC